MFKHDESDEDQIAFAAIGKKLAGGMSISDDERAELKRLADVIRAPKASEDCYWICRGSGFACNPDQPVCDCYKVCI